MTKQTFIGQRNHNYLLSSIFNHMQLNIKITFFETPYLQKIKKNKSNALYIKQLFRICKKIVLSEY